MYGKRLVLQQMIRVAAMGQVMIAAKVLAILVVVPVVVAAK
jgi:hypothetical protein